MKLDLGERIEQSRIKLGLTVSQLAKASEISEAYIRRLEQNKVKNVSLRTVNKIANALKVDEPWLIYGESHQNSGIRIDAGLHAAAIENNWTYSDVCSLMHMMVRFRNKKEFSLNDWVEMKRVLISDPDSPIQLPFDLSQSL